MSLALARIAQPVAPAALTLTPTQKHYALGAGITVGVLAAGTVAWLVLRKPSAREKGAWKIQYVGKHGPLVGGEQFAQTTFGKAEAAAESAAQRYDRGSLKLRGEPWAFAVLDSTGRERAHGTYDSFYGFHAA